MAGNKENISTSKKGMIRDSHPSNLGQESYTFMLNGNYKDTDGNFVQLQNEPSNLKCSIFKEGYKVIGHKVDVNGDRVFFFLTNPITGLSEIGQIKNITCISEATALEQECGCNVKVILETPLENQEQIPLCNYETIITDCTENKCLNFDINYPFKDGNIQFKNEKCGQTLYFTDGLNPPRYLQLDNLDIYSYIGNKSDCDIEGNETCLDCNKLRIFPLYKKPCLEPTTLRVGGNLTAGTYEFLLAYTDELGNELSPYFSITQPVPIFDLSNNILDQSQLGYKTNLGIRLEVQDLDTNYSHFKVVFIKRGGLDGAVSYKINGTQLISNNIVICSSDEDKESTTLNDILAPKTKYLTADGMASGKGYLFQYGLKAKSEINLQPVVNLMGAFGQWITVRAKEDIYKDAINIANFTGYNRDEVYPFSIRFYINDYETAVFPLIPRPMITGEDTAITGTTIDSLNRCTPNCTEIDRVEKWKILNTATIEGECVNNTDGEEELVRTETRECVVLAEDGYSPLVVDSWTGDILVEDITGYTNIVNFINQYKDDIINPASDLSLLNPDLDFSELRDILDDSDNDYPEATCDPFEGESCEGSTSTTEILALTSTSESITYNEKTFSEYENIPEPTSCTKNISDGSGSFTIDQAFIDEYMLSSENVYEVINPSNITCSNGSVISQYNNGFPFSNPQYLKHQGALSLAGILESSITISATSSEFNSNLHKGAVWYNFDFGTNDEIIIELSKLSPCNYPDDITVATNLRVSTFNTCSDTSDIDSVIISLTTGGQFKLTRTDYSSSSIKIAIDAPFNQRNIATTNDPVAHDVWTITPPCGCFNLGYRSIEYSSYLIDVSNVDFFKKVITESTCTYTLPTYNGCEPSVYQYGKFSYWESEEKYPCNNELYDSSTLKIKPSDFTDVNHRTAFEGYYTNLGAVDGSGNYILKDVDFKDKPIRHYKFPSSSEVPFMETVDRGELQETFIYPIGFNLSSQVINDLLDVAVTNGLISQEDRIGITKYEIFRGDRRTQKSVIAKGLLYDMYNYNESGKETWYPNFPYNTLGVDRLHNISYRTDNVRYTFHSPETSFYRPNLGSEIKIEGYQFGRSEGKFTPVDKHPKWVILGQPAYNLANALAIAEQVFETALLLAQLSTIGAAGGVSAPASGPLGIILAGTASVLRGVLKYGEVRQQWLTSFKNLGTPENFAYFYSSTGFYNYFMKPTSDDEKVRGFCNSSYLTSGRWTVTDEITGFATRINNTDREKSVYLNLGDNSHNYNHPSVYSNFDNAVTNPGEASRPLSGGINGGVSCQDNYFNKNIASPYVSLKQYLPDQYGRIDSIQWLNTGYCGDLLTVEDCEATFGGDTYISRFTWKKKMPLFITDIVGLANLEPFNYSAYRNIPSLQYFVDYEITDNSYSIGSLLFPTNRTSISNMSCAPTDETFYIENPAKFYLYYYGIVNFLVESDINCWLRHGKREQHERFYPQVSDYVGWTQESNVSIKEPNTFYYNDVYSRGSSISRYRPLPESYSKKEYECINDLPNGVIYSRADNSESALSDPWLVYRPFDKFEFPTSYGSLIDISFIESNQLLGRFENQVVIYNKLNPYSDGTNPSNLELGTGALFKERPLEFNSTDLGYAGTQNKAIVHCEYGHFWTDTKRGQVFQIQPNGSGLVEITTGMRNWFKEHLPFKILKSNIQGLTQKDLDNNYNSLGITMGWDSKYRRIFITKKDYKVKEGCNTTIRYEDKKFIIEIDGADTEIFLQNGNYFEDCSYTIAYSPISKSWVSYYSFKPDYYISHTDYFQTGINNSLDNTEIGLWSHLLTNNSFQVFYGKLYPWTIEIPNVEGIKPSVMHNVEYWLDVRKYFDKYDFAEREDLGFTKAWVYNNSGNTGQLNLIKSEPNNLRQKMQYPKFNSNSIDILATPKYKKWSFNYIYDITKDKNNNLQLWKNDCNQIEKQLNPLAVSYRSTWKNRLQGDWFLTRLQQDVESRFKFIFKWGMEKRNHFNE